MLLSHKCRVGKYTKNIQAVYSVYLFIVPYFFIIKYVCMPFYIMSCFLNYAIAQSPLAAVTLQISLLWD